MGQAPGPAFALALVFVVGGSAPAQAAPPADSLPRVGARVRVKASVLGSGWHTGMFNRLRVEPPCYRVLILASDAGERRVKRVLSARDLERLEVSAVYDGRSRVAPPDLDSRVDVAGEGWRDVPLELLRRADKACRVRGEGAPGPPAEVPKPTPPSS